MGASKSADIFTMPFALPNVGLAFGCATESSSATGT